MYLLFWIYDREESSVNWLLPVCFKSTCPFKEVWWCKREAGCLFIPAGAFHLCPCLHRRSKDCSSWQEAVCSVRDTLGMWCGARRESGITVYPVLLLSMLQRMHFLSCCPGDMLYMMALFKFFCVANQCTPNQCKLKITFKKVICNSDHFREQIYSMPSKSVVWALLNGQWTRVWEQLLGKKESFNLALLPKSIYLVLMSWDRQQTGCLQHENQQGGFSKKQESWLQHGPKSQPKGSKVTDGERPP